MLSIFLPVIFTACYPSKFFSGRILLLNTIDVFAGDRLRHHSSSGFVSSRAVERHGHVGRVLRLRLFHSRHDVSKFKFLHSFLHFFIHFFIHLFDSSFIPFVLYSLFLNLFPCLFLYSIINSVICLSVYLFICVFIYLLINMFIHPFDQ
jgi:hypothetical protein